MRGLAFEAHFGAGEGEQGEEKEVKNCCSQSKSFDCSYLIGDWLA